MSVGASVISSAFLFFGCCFARNTIWACYESDDGKRIGFHLCNVFGFNGRTVEIPIECIEIVGTPAFSLFFDTSRLNMLVINANSSSQNMIVCDRNQFYKSNHLLKIVADGKKKQEQYLSDVSSIRRVTMRGDDSSERRSKLSPNKKYKGGKYNSSSKKSN